MLDYHQAGQFLFHEARLMDAHAYRAWLELWAAQAHYWVPCNDDDYDPASHISIVNENRTGLENRVTRLLSGAHYAQEPKSRLSRVVSNIELGEVSKDELTIYATFNLTAFRKGVTDVIAGRTAHRLVREKGQVRMAAKKVILVDNDGVMKNLTYLI